MDKPVYLPFTETQWQLRMGLKPLNLHDWIEIDNEFVFYLDRKIDLLQHHYSSVFASLPGSEVGQKEVLDLLLNYLPERFPEYYQRHNQQITNQITQQTWNINEFADNPLDLAGRLVQEDLCLMQANSDSYILSAASVCFPLHWQLRDKLGHPIAQIHAPVPGYAEKLERPVNDLFDRLRPDRPGYRLNWSFVDTPELFLGYHRNSQPTAITVDNARDTLWFRVERQTLRRLEKSNGILFGIRTYLYPLSILETEKTIAHTLSAILQQMPIGMQQYKNLLPLRDAILGYLNRISQDDLNTTR
ncbi:MAG: DUF3445 domain-containing protein [Cyanobacteria bacterium CRU_2_1]|nr:DUF3445 domain-containing protein [Cyanobacteria bacterium RU_5_0]NJR57688.1 DUF3445 domain-containing protein [Cyanobacteria bacterium CRU_2_1]